MCSSDLSLVSFNVGVELGQLLVLALLVPALAALFRWLVAERLGAVILSAFIAHTAWHWTMDRLGTLQQFPRPALDAASLASAARWLMALILTIGAAWAVHGLTRRLTRGETQAGVRP